MEQKTHADINQIRLRTNSVKNQYLAAVQIVLIYFGVSNINLAEAYYRLHGFS